MPDDGICDESRARHERLQRRAADLSSCQFEAASDLPGVGAITNEIKVITAGGH